MNKFNQFNLILGTSMKMSGVISCIFPWELGSKLRTIIAETN
jgi:hypothetical protein